MNWDALDREVAATPMPLAYRGLFRKILCKDCHQHTTATFHIVGMKCGSCGSYNTTIDSGPLLVKVEGEERFRPLTVEEEERLGQVHFPEEESENDGESGDSDEDGWETTEEDPDDSPQLQEEELD